MSRLPLLLALATWAFGATPNALAQPSAAPANEVEQCLDAAGLDYAARQACVGRSTISCIESDEANSTTPGMVACARRERMQWAALRAVYVAELRARESDSQFALLNAMLARHPRWVEARCAYSASFYEGGSLARYLGAACMRDMEAELALALHKRLIGDP